MRLPQASPEDGGRGNYEHFTNWSIECGQRHYAYVAGPCQWFVCHASERSKPCLHWFTKGELPCKKCAAKKPVCQLGYLPLWRGTDWRPKFVILYAPEREHVEKLGLHQRVQVFRETDRGSTLTVRPALDQSPAFVTTVEHRRRPQDIWEVLLTVWDIVELTAWVRCAFPASDNGLSPPTAPVKSDAPRGASDNGLSPPTAPVKSDGQPFSDWTKKAVEKYTPAERTETETEELVKEAASRVFNRIKKLETNGNGKPKPK